MKEKKFTPGPWRWNGEAGVTNGKYGYDHVRVCDAWGTRPEMDHSEGLLEANANLIAAAPELLEALENVLKLINCHEMRNCPHVKEDGGCGGEDEDCDWLVNSKEAIKKAYGETE